MLFRRNLFGPARPREEDVRAQGHPLFAANFPLNRIELDTYAKLRCRDVCIATLDDGEGELASRRLIALGCLDVSVLERGVSGWQEAGGELLGDVNLPSRGFGGLEESTGHTCLGFTRRVGKM